MIIGVPKEVKDHEYRVSVTPDGVQALRHAGHEVLVEPSAGVGSGYADEQYRQAGAKIAPSKEALFKDAALIVKVKEPQLSETRLFRPGQVLFTYLHLASSAELTKALLEAGITAIAYETIEAKDGTLPMLKPMSEIAGKMSVQVGARYLEVTQGGRGLLLGGVPGVDPAKVVVLGAGTVGSAATRIAVGMGAQVTVINLEIERLRYLDDLYQGRIVTRASTQAAIEEHVITADLLIGAVLVPGARAPKLVSRTLVGENEAQVGDRGCGSGSRRLHRNQPADDPFGSDLYDGRRAALLCRQHARHCAAHVHSGIDQRHLAVSPDLGGFRRGCRCACRCGTGEGCESRLRAR